MECLGYVSPSSIPLSPLSTSFPGHCYLMQDDLQKAYSAYQQALYLLPNPKVKFPRLQPASFSPLSRRIPNFGMASAFSTIAMGRWITPKKLFLLSFEWKEVSISPMSHG